MNDARDLNAVGSMGQIHRTRDGRLDIDQFSRTLKPKWTMIRMNGTYFDRKGLADWILRRGKFSPTTRRPLSPAEIGNVQNVNPYRIYGKALILNKNRAAV